MRFHLPRFLVPRRKYEVDETAWLVKFGRTKGKTVVKAGQRLSPSGRVLAGGFSSMGHNLLLVARWGRMPRPWELSFESKMKSIEGMGVAFPEILRSSLPLVIGEAPSEILLRQVGVKARTQPRRFAKTVSNMFGESGKRIMVGLEEESSAEKVLETHRAPEEPFQSVIDAIRDADAARENSLR